MAYIVTNSSGTQTYQIPDQEVNQQTSISLLGRNVPNYGEPIAENFVFMLENFANDLPPARAITGQVWYDTELKQLRVRNSAGNWNLVGAVRTTRSSFPDDDRRRANDPGSMYYDLDYGILYVATNTSQQSDQNKWRPAIVSGEIANVAEPNQYQINNANVLANPPATVSRYGTQLKNLFVTDDTGIQRAVLALEYVQGAQEVVMAVFSDHDEFEANTDVAVISHGEIKSKAYTQQLNSSNGIGTTIRKGLNLRADNRTRVEVSNVSDHANLAFALNTGSYENGVANLALTITADNVAHQDADFVPNAADTYSLGNASNMFGNVYATTVWLGNGVGGGIVKNGSSEVVIGDPLAPIDEAYFDQITSNTIAATSASISSITGNLAGDVVGNVTGNVTGQVSDISNHSTTDLTEGDNLYYTTARVRTNVSVDAQSNLTYDNVSGVFGHQLTTTDIVEGDSLYFSTQRVRGNISAVTVGNDLGEFGNLSYNSSTGVHTFVAPTTAQVRGHLSNGAGLEYSVSTGVMSVGEGFGITVDTDTVAINTPEVRSVFEIAAGSQGILGYDNASGVFSFLGNQSTATSLPSRWVFSDNINQNVAGIKTFQNTTRFVAEGASTNIRIENSPRVQYGAVSGGSGSLLFENIQNPGTSITFSEQGDIVASGDITAFSDRRLKQDLKQITSALDKVRTLTGYTFERIDVAGKRQTGLVAQEVQDVLPEAVTQHHDLLAVSYGNMIGLIVEAIKELSEQVQDLSNKLEK